MLLTSRLRTTNHALRARIIACALAVFLAVMLLPSAAYADVRKADIICGQTVEQRGLTVAQCPNVVAERVYVVDSEGNVYFERNADEDAKIASITKVMTALVSLDYGKDDDVISVSEEAAKIGESSADLKAGDSTDFISMLKALMVPSGNDAAVALAEFYGAVIVKSQGGNSSDVNACVSAFVDKMNAKAKEIGMSSTVFTNPHGLDNGKWEGDLHSSAKDVAKMVSYAMKIQKFRDVAGIDGCSITVNRAATEATGEGENQAQQVANGKVSITLEPTDEMLATYQGACGVKTGFTETAGNCFAAAVNRDGKEVYAIILKSTTEQQRFTDAEACCDWLFKHDIDYPLANSPQKVTLNVRGIPTEVPVIAYAGHSGWVDVTYPVTLKDPDQTVEIFDLNGNVSQEIEMKNVSGDVHIGDEVGTIKFKQHNGVIASATLVACGEQRGPNLFESIGVTVDRFFRGLSGQPKQAKTQVINQPTLLLDKTA